jgi:hypothetical protein
MPAWVKKKDRQSLILFVGDASLGVPKTQTPGYFVATPFYKGGFFIRQKLGVYFLPTP